MSCISGIIPPRREHSSERPHSEQLEQISKTYQSVSASVCRHLSVLHRAVQVHRRRDRERVSFNLIVLAIESSF